MGVLTRTNKIIKAIEKELIRNGIPYREPKKSMFYKRVEVEMILLAINILGK